MADGEGEQFQGVLAALQKMFSSFLLQQKTLFVKLVRISGKLI